jgi:CO/xanthine dehydrogenase Mo-binding subunit
MMARSRATAFISAIANAAANAMGLCFPDLPLTPERIFSRLAQRS